MLFPIANADAAVVDRLAAGLGVRPVTARCLALRGVTAPDEARAFLEPKLSGLRRPEGLVGLDVAIERLERAVVRGERVGVWGDYDVDGVTTAALLTSFLRAVGANVVARVARRDGGYGFTVEAATGFADSGCSLIVTGDCGTSDQTAIAAVAVRGVEVIVIDHHTVPSGGDHPALALVNPFRPDSTFPFRAMASVGLAFYAVAALRTRLRAVGWFKNRPEPDVRELLDLVAVGTIADLVPLQGENRIMTALGLKLLEERRRPGLAALLAAAGVATDSSIDEKTVSWRLAPRLNAPGRLGPAAPSLDLLLADPARASACAAALEDANNARRAAQDAVMQEAEAKLDAADGAAVVLAGQGWPAGVVGIVAAKVVDKAARPAFVIAVDEHGVGRGSARSAGGVDLYRALADCAPLLERFGGHRAAAGFTVRAENIEALRQRLDAAVAAQTPTAESGEALYDAEVRLGELDERLATELATFGPFGPENRAPHLVSRGVEVKSARTVGDGTHLKLELGDGNEVRGAIAFGLAHRAPAVGERVNVAYLAMVSSWKGRRRVEMEVKEIVRTE